MKRKTTGFLALSLVVSTLFFSGCGSDGNSDKGTLNDEITQQFRHYATDTDQWMKVETLFGPDPAIASDLSVAHGTGSLFRTIYKSPVDAKVVNGVYADGTLLVKELRLDDNGELGEITGSTTVMIKEAGEWTYLKLTSDLKQIEAMGTSLNNKVGSVKGCVTCHTQAAAGDDFTFPPREAVGDAVESLEDFLDYKTSAQWTLIESLRGRDPAGALFGDKHALNQNLYRTIYKKQTAPKVNGAYPAGTIFLKELSMPDVNDVNKSGDIVGALTIMLKQSSGAERTNNWEYFMTNPERNAIMLQGMGSDATLTKENNVSGCINCHAIAQSRDTNNDLGRFNIYVSTVLYLYMVQSYIMTPIGSNYFTTKIIKVK